ILIGEMRDLETIQAAITIAETGHLVFATLHTNDAPSTIHRIIDVFPAHQQPQVRNQLSMVLRGVFTQSLIPHASGNGRVLCVEILINTPAIANLIRESKIEQIPMLMQTGSKFGMQTANMFLADLVYKRRVTQKQAFEVSTDHEELQKLIQQRQ